MAKAAKKPRRFARVPKTKSGVPLKYLKGLTGAARAKREREILSAKKKYKAGTLSKSTMNKMARRRARDAKKK